MANWAFTTYYVVGDKDVLNDLNEKMKEVESMDEDLIDNDFGRRFLGNLVVYLGGEVDGYHGVYCRGSWSEREMLDDGTLTFMTETAWDEMKEWRGFLETKFPGLKFFYFVEDPGMSYYKTNDMDGRFFPDNYVLEICGADDDESTVYLKSLSEAAERIGQVVGKELTEEDDLNKELETWAEETDGVGCAELHEVIKDC